MGCDAAGLDAAAATIRTAVAEQHALGAVILALRGRTMLLHEAFGSRDVQGKQPMQKDTLFRMASNTKAITAAAVLTLVDEGKLALDDPIAKWFPTWSEGLAGKVTVQQLLTHSSGLRSALSHSANPPAEAMPIVREAITREQDELTRLELARFLTQDLSSYPDNVATLRKVLATESSRQVRRLVGEALAAHDAAQRRPFDSTAGG